jgi:addiction module RelB/DinJ family antitoxin
MTTTLLIKLDKALKEKAQKTAKDLGLPMSTVISNYLRDFVIAKEVTFKASMPNAKTIKAIEQSRKDYKEGKTKSFSTMEAFIKDLNS